MVTNTPVRNPHNSTADLLTWPENPVADSSATGSAASAARSSARSHQPSDGISKVVFGGQITDEEVESLNKRKPVSGYKLKETTGSGIFAASKENNIEAAGANPNPANKTGLRMYQQTVSGLSHISFGDEESKSPKKTLSEAKQRELGGTFDKESDATFKKQFTNAKNKELNGTLDNELDSTFKKQFTNARNKELIGNNIFGPPPEVQPHPLAARALAVKESIGIGESATNKTSAEDPTRKTTKTALSQKHTVLSGKTTFKGDAAPAPSEKLLSSTKLREMTGSDIFADGKAESRDFLGGRKPPGGESTIALI